MKRAILILFISSSAIAATTTPTGFPLLSHSHVNGTVVPSTTVYIPIGNTVISEFPPEAWAQIPIYSSGVISGLYVRLEDNSIANNSTWTIRINGVSGNETVALASGVKIGTDTTHTDRINYGDKVDVMLKTGSGGTTLNPIAMQVFFSPATPINYQRMSPAAPNVGLSITNGFQPYYSNITGIIGQNFFEAHTFHVMRTSGTFRNAAVYVATNTRTETTPYVLRKNGADTALSINVPSATTGLFQNTTSQVSITAGDTVEWELGMNNGSDSNPIIITFLSSEYISSGTEVEYAVGTDDKPQNAGETWTIPYQAALTYGGDEYLVQPFKPGVLHRFCMTTAQNDVSTVSTVKVRKNGVTDPNIVMTIPIATTGTFCDNTHSLTVTSTDTIAYIGNSPAGTGTLYYASISAALTERGPSDSLQSFSIFPANNIWNTAITSAPISSSNTLWMDGNNGHSFHDFHPDFGSGSLSDGSLNGIPYNIVFSTTPGVSAIITTYATESDTPPASGMPVPTDTIIEGDPLADSGSDRHMLMVNQSSNTIYELFSATRTTGGSYTAAQYSLFYATSNALRPDNFTSADAAGLPILPGLLRWDEVSTAISNGTMVIPHALRFTLELTHGPHLWPARHDADTGSSVNPPFGMRVRMKSTVDVSSYGQVTQVIFNTLKKYGMFMADNGGDWYLSGAPNDNWNNDQLHTDFIVVGTPNAIFEVVDESTWMVDPNSGQAQIPVSNNGTIRGNGIIKGNGTVFLK